MSHQARETGALTHAQASWVPHSVAAEQNVLGGLMLEQDKWTIVSPMLAPNHFYRHDHRLIFESIEALAKADKPRDPLSVSEHLERRGELSAAGGFAYLGTLTRDTPGTSNLGAYADVILERAVSRSVVEAAHMIESSATDGSGLAAVLSTAEQALAPFRERLARATRRPAISWISGATQDPPAREWIVNSWIPAGHVTLLAGSGGSGKTLIAQAIGAAVACGRDYLADIPRERRVLFWACEDDEAELARRQRAIASLMGEQIGDFDGKFYMHSYEDELVDLAGETGGRLVAMPMLEQLKQQIGDYRAELVILDNIARLFAGNETNRHQVTSFIAMLKAAARPTSGAILLIGHPGKAAGSEYSGSTAWEAAVRARLYLGDKLPDEHPLEEEMPDDGVRYLCRRKSNYSPKDWRRVRLVNGVMVPDQVEQTGGFQRGGEFVADVVIRALSKLIEIGKAPNGSPGSPSYLPKLAEQFKLLDGVSKRQFQNAMREMQMSGRIKQVKVGIYPNRSPRLGLAVAE